MQKPTPAELHPCPVCKRPVEEVLTGDVICPPRLIFGVKCHERVEYVQIRGREAIAALTQEKLVADLNAAVGRLGKPLEIEST